MSIAALLQTTATYFDAATQQHPLLVACSTFAAANEPLKALDCLEQLLAESPRQKEEYMIWNGLRTAFEQLGITDKEQHYRQLVTTSLLRAVQPLVMESPDFSGTLRYLSWFEKGRLNPVASGYRAQFKYGSAADWSAQQKFIGKDVCFPGETALTHFKLYQRFPQRLQPGQPFVIREGSTVVATGVLAEVF